MKPILLNTEMVRAILDGRKTVTRRVVKPQPPVASHHDVCFDYIDDLTAKFALRNRAPHYVKLPYRVGDILYVRETWYINNITPHDPEWNYKADYNCTIRPFCDWPWKSPVQMPREAARLFLQVKNVRVERLQECGKGWCLDIEKEGIQTPQDPILYISDNAFHDALREKFRITWDGALKPKDLAQYGWDANPWVWVVEFERVEKEKVQNEFV